MVKTFGNYTEVGGTQEFLIVSFASTLLTIQDRWRNNSLSADFLASYWGTFFPPHDRSSHPKRAEVFDSVSFIANELLENAVKFNYEAPRHPIRIALYLHPEELRFYVTNCIQPDTAKRFQDFIEQLQSEDPAAMYIHQLESEPDEELGVYSRLGFLAMINDYEVDLAWKFETLAEDPVAMAVTTLVRLGIVRN